MEPYIASIDTNLGSPSYNKPCVFRGSLFICEARTLITAKQIAYALNK